VRFKSKKNPYFNGFFVACMISLDCGIRSCTKYYPLRTIGKRSFIRLKWITKVFFILSKTFLVQLNQHDNNMSLLDKFNSYQRSSFFIIIVHRVRNPITFEKKIAFTGSFIKNTTHGGMVSND